jgi:hypothetical protein
MTTEQPIEDDLVPQVRQTRFHRDAERVVRIIAERHRASGAVLTWQLVREIREEALADIGLASRWPAQLLDALAAASVVPPLDGWLSQDEMESLCDFAKPIRETFDPLAVG